MSYRNEQVSKELLKALSRVIQEELPLEKYGLVAVTDVVVTRGLEHAKVFVSAMRHGRNLVKELNERVHFFTARAKKLVALRKIPTITFEYDISNERVERMEELMGEG